MSDVNFELNTILFESTFKIEQSIGPTSAIIGTTFVVGRPYPNDPTKARYVLVTAKHVLDAMPGNDAIWHLRQKDADGIWHRLPFPVRIRTNGVPSWVSHPAADVAAMYAQLPQNTINFLLTISMFADDAVFNKFEVHPGDELNCLGYPMGWESDSTGFPILRSGKIASYPLYPSKDYPTFLYDFEVFDGNSGGPVFMVESNRNFAGSTHVGKIQFIAGLVSQQALHVNERLALSVVVHPDYILQTINMLPSLSP